MEEKVKKLHVAVVGLRFGKSFAQIFRVHPAVGEVTLFDPDAARVKFLVDTLPGVKVANSFEEILEDPSIDAVHLVSPIPFHADQTVKVLEAGKHCACAVPMATSLEDIRRIFSAVRRSGKNYMMMETSLYTYHYFYVSQMIQDGTLGKIPFLRGSHYQDMANWPLYWMGLPPMWYGTHAIAPMVGLSGSRICRVNCFGSGTMDEELVRNYGNPYPIESGLFEFENGLKGEVTRSLFETARTYQEGMFVYGSKYSFEWGFAEGEDPYVTFLGPILENIRGKGAEVNKVPMPDYSHLLPEEIREVSKGHHGSHTHLVHEFISSILEERKPWIDEVLAANITAAGICAHESAMQNGAAVIVPKF